MPGRFAGKVVIVTGSSNGIGRAAARSFAAEGAKVTLTGRNPEALKEARAELLSAGAAESDVIEVAGDISDESVQKSLIDQTIEKFGRLDVLINNAGAIAPDRSVVEHFAAPIEHFDFVLKVNLRSVLTLTQLAIPHLSASKGSIVNISSIASKPFPSSVPYYAISKAGLDQLTVQLAGELASKGIRVNAVNPGYVRTTIVEKQGLPKELVDKVRISSSSSSLQIDVLAGQALPAGRAGRPEDIAHAILFLADNNTAGYIIGQTLVVDGGELIHKPPIVSLDLLK